MALSTLTVWEVEATGSDANGGGFVVGSSGTDKTYSPNANAAPTTRTNLLLGIGSAPTAPAPTTATTGGTIAAGTYYFVVSYTAPAGETVASAQGSVTTTGTTSTITVPSPTSTNGATGWKCYGGTTNGSAWTLQGGVNSLGTALTLTAPLTTTGAAPLTTSTANQTFYSATAFAASDVGNLINVTAGTGFTTGFYQIVSVSSGIAVLDRAAGTAGSSAGTGTVGGALATPQAAANAMVAGNRMWIRYGTYGAPSSSAPVLNVPSALNVSSVTNTQPPTWISGYYQTRGDLGYGPKQASLASKRPTLQLATTSTASYVVNVGYSTYNVLFENLIADANNVSSAVGITLGLNNYVRNCLAIRYGQSGFQANGNALFEFCEATNPAPGASTASGFNIFQGTANAIIGCHAHDGGIGVNIGPGNYMWRCLIANNANDGVRVSYGGYGFIAECTIVNNGGNGINNITTQPFGTRVCDCVIEGNNGYGYLACSSPGYPTDPMFDGNAYYANVSGAIGNLTSGGLTGVPAYTNQYDVLSSAELLNNPVDLGDFGLNNNNPGGAKARGATWISQWPLNSAASGLSTTVNQADLGAAQSTPAATGGISPRPLIVRPTTVLSY